MEGHGVGEGKSKAGMGLRKTGTAMGMGIPAPQAGGRGRSRGAWTAQSWPGTGGISICEPRIQGPMCATAQQVQR